MKVSQVDDRETVDKFLNSRVLRSRFIGHSTLNGSWYPDVDEIDPHVEYLIPTTAFRRHDRGQNLGFRQGVDQGGLAVSGWSMLLKCCEIRDSETFTRYSEQRKISTHFAHRWQRNWQVLLESL